MGSLALGKKGPGDGPLFKAMSNVGLLFVLILNEHVKVLHPSAAGSITEIRLQGNLHL